MGMDAVWKKGRSHAQRNHGSLGNYAYCHTLPSKQGHLGYGGSSKAPGIANLCSSSCPRCQRGKRNKSGRATFGQDSPTNWEEIQLTYRFIYPSKKGTQKMDKTPSMNEHSSAWIIQTWVAFAVSTCGMLYGIYSMQAESIVKVFMAVCLLFVVSASLNLAKTTRDIHESKKIISKVSESKMQKFLIDNDLL